MKLRNFFKRSIGKGLDEIVFSGKERDQLFEEIEEQLVLGDISTAITGRIIGTIKKNCLLHFLKVNLYLF